MADFNLTIQQAVRNAQILHFRNVTFTADDKGNIDYVGFNILKRLVLWIKNLIDGTAENKINRAILATFQTINAYAKEHPENPIWTYPVEDCTGKDFDIGFDKVAMRILLDRGRFPSHYNKPSAGKEFERDFYNIREEAYKVMLLAGDQRRKDNVSFDCDHLPSPKQDLIEILNSGQKENSFLQKLKSAFLSPLFSFT